MHTQIIRPPAFQKPSGHLELSASQLNIVNATQTLIAFDQIRAGFTDGIEDITAHKITPGKAGFYSIAANICFFNTVANKKYCSELEISGSQVALTMVHTALAEHVDTPISIASIYLSATDYLMLYAYHEAGVDTIDVGKSYTYLSIQRVR